MKFLANASALFVGLRVSTSFHQALQVAPTKEGALKDARRAIRNAIRTAGQRIRLDEAFWEPAFAKRSVNDRPNVQPKFFTQGSVAYDLLIDPCQRPPQQIDLDDGMYVRVDYLDGRPALVAKALFAMVEAALTPLCRERNWTLNKTKDTCVRIEISNDSHIDLPIYSAPAKVTNALAEDVMYKMLVAASARGAAIYKLPSDEIMLALRDGTWMQSDPLKLHDWVEACAARYGEGFRRACRYLKGWRDHQWAGTCLSSITIMAAVAEAMKQLDGSHQNFDDDRLVYEISQRLPAILRSDLLNPAFPDRMVVLNDWSDDEREDVVAAAEELAGEMRSALTGTYDPALVVAALRRAFGHRIPMRPDAVNVLPVAAAVTALKPATVAAPRIIKSTSG